MAAPGCGTATKADAVVSAIISDTMIPRERQIVLLFALAVGGTKTKKTTRRNESRETNFLPTYDRFKLPDVSETLTYAVDCRESMTSVTRSAVTSEKCETSNDSATRNDCW